MIHAQDIERKYFDLFTAMAMLQAHLTQGGRDLKYIGKIVDEAMAPSQKAIEAQKEALAAVARRMDEEDSEQCATCGDHHEHDRVPFTCETGDGV